VSEDESRLFVLMILGGIVDRHCLKFLFVIAIQYLKLNLTGNDINDKNANLW